MDKLEELKQFFKERSLLRPSSIGMESGVSVSLLHKVLNMKFKLTNKTWDKLYPVMVKYGYKEAVFSGVRAEVCKRFFYWETCKSWNEDYRCLSNCKYHHNKGGE